MIPLPKPCQLVEMLRSYREDVPNIGFARIARSNGVRSVCQRNIAIQAKIDNHFRLGIEPMDVPGLMIVGIGHEPNAVEPERSHIEFILT
jgi:hypothetical protein